VGRFITVTIWGLQMFAVSYLGVSIERLFAGVPMDFTKIGLMESVAIFVVRLRLHGMCLLDSRLTVFLKTCFFFSSPGHCRTLRFTRSFWLLLSPTCQHYLLFSHLRQSGLFPLVEPTVTGNLFHVTETNRAAIGMYTRRFRLGLGL
jgi:hypothetical protein